MATRSERTLSRHYAKLAVVSSVPLIVLIIALAYVHYAEQHQRRLENLLVVLGERHQKVQRTLSATENHVDQMRRWAVAYLANEDRRLSRLLPLLTVLADQETSELTGYFLEKGVNELQPAATGSFIGDSLALAGGADSFALASLALDMYSIQQLGHASNLQLQQSYFLPNKRHFVSIYPASEWDEFRALEGAAANRPLLHEFFDRNVFQNGMPESRPSRMPYWIAPQKWLLNKDLVISHAVPVYEANRFVGVVGADLSLTSLHALLRVPKIDGAAAQIVNSRGVVLASIGEVDPDIYEAAADAPMAFQTMTELNAEAFVRSDGYFVLRLPISGISWNLDYAIPASALTEGLAWRFLPYGLILAGLIATLVCGQLLVRSQFVQPVLAFAHYIRAGARGDSADLPALPRVWKPWLSLLRATFGRHRDAMEQLRESEDRHRRLVELSPEGIMLHDKDHIVFVNQAGAKILGLASPDDVLDAPHSYMDFVAEAEREAAAARVARVLEEGLDIPMTERSIRDANGREKHIEVMATPFRRESGDIVALVIFRDITRRKSMERAVRDSEERFRAISEAIPLPIIISDSDTYTLRYINPAVCNQLSIDGDLLDSLTIFDLCRDGEFKRNVQDLIRGGRWNDSREMEVRRPNGETFWARVTTVPMQYQGADALLYAIVDLTERVAAEVEIARQREAFHQKEKIAALGSLLAGLAHELNNPLSVVSGQSLMLEEAVTDETQTRRAQRIREAAERCSRIVRTFLSMARSRAPARTALDLNATVHSALELVSYGLKSSGVALSTELDKDMPPMVGDADQLHHVLTNLVVNAEQAMRDVEGPRSLIVSTRYDKEAQRAFLSVADTGPGIEVDVADRIFEPFFTTKKGAAGTGIGLALCRDIVADHGGEIRFEANKPVGTVFTVCFPLSEDAAECSAPQPVSETTGETGSILVVDDDVEVAITLADVLRLRGHDVETAFGGREGLEKARDQTYDIVISDVRMPDLDGPNLFLTLRAEVPDLDRRMLFMTGDTLGVDVAALVRETNITVIEKPLDPASVAGLIDERLLAMRQSEVAASD